MENLMNTVEFLQSEGFFNPEIGIVLGTGLGGLINEIEVEKSVDYDKIPNFPVSTVESHHGKLIYGKLSGKRIIAMQGRFHFYEGYSFQQVTFPIRVMKLLGIKFLLLSNAAGAINLDFKKGSLMMITDHINLLPGNPLTGENFDELGPRFPDMSKAYSPEINKIIEQQAAKLKIKLNKGVYVAVAGPNLETPAEYRFLKVIGADAVGMSTVPEVIVANHMSLPCAAISVLTDECDPDNLQEVSLQEIIEVAAKAELDLIKLFKKIVAEL
ncbi:MAG: purine-nucleoside phosphorylase [Bacteroidales bacterium]|nr:purine-nucleoside phosphorylase [Bacteroidales bacterium]